MISSTRGKELSNSTKTKEGLPITEGTKRSKKQTLELVKEHCAKNKIRLTFENLDKMYYHASQHLYAFTESFFRDKKAAKKWTHRQLSLLMESKVDTVLHNIGKLAPDNKEARNLIEYYQSNKTRMDYKHYRQIGCGIIGSGAIESAHRAR